MQLLPLESFRHTTEQCNHCGQCKWLLGPKTRGVDFAEICPIHIRFNFDAYSGQGLLNMAQEIIEGRLAPDADLVEAVYTCTTCGACDTNCKSVRDMEVLETILAMRRRIVESGAGPLPAHARIAALIARHHNLYGLPHEQRFAWLADQDAPGRDTLGLDAPSPDTRTAYYVGDPTAYRFREIGIDTMRILRAARLPFTLLGSDEWNDGNWLWRTGQAEAARVVAQHNIDAFRARGIRTVVCSDAASLSVLRDFYPRVAKLDFEAVHITELVHEWLDEGRLEFTRAFPGKVTYHDSCHLGRLSEPFEEWSGEIRAFNRHVPAKNWRRGTHGIYDAPRAILRRIPGLELVEMVRNEEGSFCCGAGGGVAESRPDLAQATARERLREARSTGATWVVSCDPGCQANLRAAGDGSAQRHVDITRLIAESLSTE